MSRGTLEVEPGVRWKYIEGYPDYLVTDNGRVFSNKSGHWKPLKPQRNAYGYVHVVLCKNGRLRTTLIQYLVATHFIGPRPKGLVICHNDGDGANNHVGNLRYDTQKSNIADIKIHGTENPPKGVINGMSRLTEAQVLEIRRLRMTQRLTHKVLGQKFGISREHARDIVNRKAWKHV